MEAFVNKTLLAVLLTFGLAYGNSNFQNTFYGGLAIATGEGSEYINPGITACIEPLGKINKYFGIGGHVDYTWLSVKKPNGWDNDNFSFGFHMWDLALVPKAFIPISEDANIAFEIDPGLSLDLVYFNMGNYSDSDLQPNFGLTSGISINIKSFAFAFKFKNVFSDEDVTNWITFSVGHVFKANPASSKFK
jgi:hypothetical protein